MTKEKQIEEIEKIMFCGDLDNKYLVKLMYSNEYDELKKKYTEEN